MALDKGELEKIYDREHDRILKEWSEFLSFKSISTDPAYDADCRKCAEWLVKHLEGIGCKAWLVETIGKPLVMAEYGGSGAGPAIVYYGHYDVQPVDPLAEWSTEPFTATLKGERLYARGAQDNKGQTFFVIKALEALIRAKALTSKVTLIIEGEEESGSEGLTELLPKWKDVPKGDVLMVCDTGALVPGVPFVTMGLRGLVRLQVTLSGIHHDLHSGALGGVVKNPATEISRLVATLHDANGKIAIPGYYDEVRDFSAEDRQLANASWIDENTFQKMIGVPSVGGEEGFTPAERRGFRPTIEVNGIYGGYQGPGTKTIIPASATVKLTARLVADQDPERCLKLIVQHIERHAPKGLELTIEDTGIGGKAVALSVDAPLVKKTRAVLEQLAGGKIGFTWEGGSIPIVASLAEVMRADPLLVGFGLEEDRIHAPNESFSLHQFKLGFLYVGMMVQELAR